LVPFIAKREIRIDDSELLDGVERISENRSALPSPGTTGSPRGHLGFGNFRFTKPKRHSSRPQIQELIDASKVSVFFIDDRQVVRPGEVGSGLRQKAKR